MELEHSTLVDEVARSAALLSLLANGEREHLMAALKLHADDTPVLVPELGQTNTGRRLVHFRDQRPFGSGGAAAVFYRCNPDQKGKRHRGH